jgi:hypothetical protein
MVLPPIDVLRRLFVYNPITGELIHRFRPREDFSHSRHWRMWRRRYEGRSAGSLRVDGYVMVVTNIGGVRHSILAHRLIWAIVNGEWVPEVDHRDGCGSNNRLDNLRAAIGQSENMQNMAGRRGTRLDRRSGRYQAVIGAAGKRIHLGIFATEAEAHSAYLEAKQRHHRFQPVPR